MKFFIPVISVTIVACGVKIAPSPMLADSPSRLKHESDRRAEFEAAHATPTPRPSPTLTPTPAVTPLGSL